MSKKGRPDHHIGLSDKEMCGQIDKLADREHISRNEQIRRFIKKGIDSGRLYRRY